jgi:hypothetical protein
MWSNDRFISEKLIGRDVEGSVSAITLTIRAFVWRAWENPQETSESIECLDINPGTAEYKVVMIITALYIALISRKNKY